MPYRVLQFVVFAAVALGSCAANTMQPSELTSTGGLIDALKKQNLSVSRAEAMARSAYPFFSVNAQRIVVKDEDVQVFEYHSSALANSDAAKVSPTGTPVGQSQIAWMATPHFYKRDRLIVLYVGHSGDILKALETTLGPPFAAGR
jgi:hypothetical protein